MKGGRQFVIGALPLGGYVKLKGEHDTDTAKGSYGAADLWTKTKIMGAGVFMNLVTAFLLLMVLAWLGMPKIMDNQFTVASDTKVISRGQHHVVLEEKLTAGQQKICRPDGYGNVRASQKAADCYRYA